MTRDLAVILAAHGAGDESLANEQVRRLAERIAARVSLPVAAAFNIGHPTYEEALAETNGRRVLVVPLMTSDGWFARRVVPKRFGAIFQQTPASCGRRCAFSSAAGARPSVIRALAERTMSTIRAHAFDPGATSVVVIGHGTSRHSGSGDSTVALARAVADAVPGVTALAAFLDQDPRIEDVVQALATPAVVVVPYLLGGGYHATQDISARLGQVGGRHFVLEPPLLDEPVLVDAVLECIDDHRLTLRLGTRRSALALWQARRVASRLRAASGREVSLVELDAAGDLDLTTPVGGLPGEAPFCDEITAALARGEIDLATHSLKDLPLQPDPALPVVAVLPRGPVEEVLVARGGAALADLPRGARVGVSCERRAAQLWRLRPDLQPAAIRGPVDRRVAQVRDGAYDAAVLAAAGVERLGLGRHVTQRFTIEDFTPAAGQGAIAVQGRADDASSVELARSINHEPTWRAVQAELLVTRALETRVRPFIVAASARPERTGDLMLFVRVISPDGRIAIDERVRAAHPETAAHQAAARVLSRLAGIVSPEAAA